MAISTVTEQDRVKALHQLLILDSPYETLFDSIVKAASDICEKPIALISLVDENRQWFKAKVGLPSEVTQTPREYAFCAKTILSNEILEVMDASQDDRFFDNPLVTGDPNIRFYAGFPITMPAGENIGTVCVIDSKPGGLNLYQRKALQGLSDITSKALTARLVSLKMYHHTHLEDPLVSELIPVEA
ncbi:GAF domain-containing protein [Methylobacillus gramineus]|uniref:GAF domain-containing protein n=1 Tax=Methylobacillus gramineus TaxID=755169 RepID=UPI001CFFBEB0|nr:GAF domain-containing protein [Methylobacillus gramineus]MCB5184287.1 GAF domain-containing protein [Methylobacillus gramineus]